jgi:hypothetical protein
VENTVTNNTLQLFGRIYEHSASAASRLLSELTGEAVYIGIEITQQNRANTSVPDGTLIQRSFKIAVETKVDAPMDFDQLRRHALSFGTEELKILLLLTKEPTASHEKSEILKIQEKYPGVVIKSITFEGICNVISQLFKPYEESIIKLADDYIEYCNDTGLFDQSRELMRIVPCGESVDINQTHQIYFQPSDRGYTRHAFVGIYNQKAVRGVLKIKSVFDVELIGADLKKELVEGDNTNVYDESIRAIIADAKTNCNYDIETGYRFFCGKMVSTNYQKVSLGGIQGARFVNLRQVLGQYGDVDDIASKLSKVTWE